MSSRSTTLRICALLLLVASSTGAMAQNEAQGSPYSAFGFGDLVQTNQLTSALMGGATIAVSEPYSISTLNPASYAASRQRDLGGLQRPVFEVGVRGSFLNLSSSESTVRRKDAGFMGFSLGVPFGRGRWGMGLGVTPFSDVGYSLVRTAPFEGGTMRYEYSGSGGLNRAFAGVARVLWQQKPDEQGDPGDRLVLGANFEYIFGGIERSRKAVYPVGQGYTNTSAFSSLVLSAPTAGFGLHYSSQFIRKETVAARVQSRTEARRKHYEAWRAAHGGETHPRADRTAREASAWRYTIGLVAGLPTDFNATATDLNTLFLRGSTGSEQVLDTLPGSTTVSGTLSIPLSYGIGASVHDDRFLFTAEMRRRDWSAVRSGLEGIDPGASLRAGMLYAVGARYTPSTEGGFFQRITYRAGARQSDDYSQVLGTALRTTAFSAGLSIPLNAAQTNSWLHIGGEFDQRGTTDNGLLQERNMRVWLGLSITPWRSERWFRPYQIQ